MQGSDHCPVFATLKTTIDYGGVQKNILDIVNPEGMYQGGERQTSVLTPLAPRLCMKRFPEFSQRRNIKDMFSKMSYNKTLAKTTQGNAQTLSTQKVDSPTGPPAKRQKTSYPVIVSKNPKNSKSQSQQTLRGFFQPTVNNMGAGSLSSISYSQPFSPGRSPTPVDPKPDDHSEAVSLVIPESMSPPKDESAGFIDQIESKEKWSQLFSKRRPPVCDAHGEECIQLTTKKPGPNCGRAFWMCQRYLLTPCLAFPQFICFLLGRLIILTVTARPIGPEGESMVKSGLKTEWKCNFFKWASDL